MIISQFATDPVLEVILDKHHAWHTPGGAHGFPSRAIPLGSPGSGLEFFNFHKQLMDDFFAWNTAHAAVALALVAPWPSIPAALKATSFWNATHASEELRLNTNVPPFANADALGIYIETGIHNNFLHAASAEAYSEPLVGTFHSPQSTYFYQIHGLVNFWWNQWFPSKTLFKEVVDHKLAIVDKLHKEHIKDIQPEKILTKELIKELIKEVIKEKDKDIWEGDWRERLGDPVIRAHIEERLKALERTVAERKQHFIRQRERPAVARVVTERASARKRGKK